VGRRTLVASWGQGRATIEQLIHGGRLSRVPADTDVAAHYLALAEGHLSSSRMLASDDPVGAFGLACDTASSRLLVHAEHDVSGVFEPFNEKQIFLA